jgi:hypothetical protein
MEAIFAKYASTVDGSGNGTDKDTCHSYLPVYKSVLEPLRDTPLRMLEVGVMTGASLRAWDEYFTHPDKDIHGADIHPEWLTYEVKNYHVVDATQRSALSVLGDKPWDVIIDDASHLPMHQLQTLEIFGPLIKSGGYYIIEDIVNLDVAQVLYEAGTKLGFDVTLHDLRPIKNRADDIMLVMKKT